MNIGTMLHHRNFNGVVKPPASTDYQQAIAQPFKHFGMRGSGIFGMIAPNGPDLATYQWDNIDRIVEFCEQNNLYVHFNTILFGHIEVYPEWFRKLTSEAKLKVLETHVKAVVERYKGRVEFFKLMNETLGGPDENFLDTGKGKAEIVASVFKWAKEVYPEGRYMLNEHSPSFRAENRQKLLDLLKEVKAQGAEIDLIGLQAHMGYHPRPFMLPPDKELEQALREIHEAAGVPIHITEFDLSWNNSPQKDSTETRIDPNKPITVDDKEYTTWYEYQAYAYKHFAEICRDLDFVEGFYYWAFNEQEEWERPDCGMFNTEYKPRPEMLEWVEELREQIVPREEMIKGEF